MTILKYPGVVVVSIVLFLGGIASFAEPVVDDFVRVTGAVNKPGRYPWKESMTAMDAIDAAGGLSKTTDGKAYISISDAHGTRRWIYNAEEGYDAAQRGPILTRGASIDVRNKRRLEVPKDDFKPPAQTK